MSKILVFRSGDRKYRKRQIVPWAHRSASVPPRLAQPRATAPRLARGMSRFWVRWVAIPGHALHEKGLQRQIGFGPLVNSQERRALAVSVVNRSLCSPIGLQFVLPKSSSGQLSSMPWQASGTFASLANRPVGFPSCLAPPRPTAPPCATPLRPAHGISGLCTRQVYFEHLIFPDMHCMKKCCRDKKASAYWSAARNEERPQSRL